MIFREITSNQCWTTPKSNFRLEKGIFSCFGAFLTFLIILSLTKPAFAYTGQQAVRACIGEASNQGYRGMLAVACAIRNRGTLTGVYGLNAPHIDKEPQWVWAQAQRAWEESKFKDITNGATNWHNVKREGGNYWTKKMIKVFEYKGHVFYREK